MSYSTTNPSAAPTSLTRRISRRISLSFGKGRGASNASGRTPSPTLASSPTDSYFHPSQLVAPVPSIALTRTPSRQPLAASPSLAAPARAKYASPASDGTLLRRKSTRRVRLEENEDQAHDPAWRERHRAAAGFFDAQQTVVPDTTAMHSTPAVAYTIQPSSLSTFAVRGPLVARQPSAKA